MGSTKKLKSIAHNIAHSYLSLSNYIESDFVNEIIYSIAKSYMISEIKINITNQDVEPKEFRTPEILQSIEYLNQMLERLLMADGIDNTQVSGANINIIFSFEDIQCDIFEDEKPAYKCISTIIDSRGMKHEADVVEWWKY